MVMISAGHRSSMMYDEPMTNHTDTDLPETTAMAEFADVTVQTITYRGRAWTYVATSKVEEVLVTPDGRHIDAYVAQDGTPSDCWGEDLAIWLYVQAYNC